MGAPQEKKKCVSSGRHADQPSHKRYRAEGRAMRRQFERIERHIAAHPNDATAPAALARLEAARFGVAVKP